MAKVKFRDITTESSEEFIKLPFSECNKKQQSEVMTRTYVEKIIKQSLPNLVPLDDDDLRDCYVDGKDDCGVDFISVTEGQVLIIQAKYHSKKDKNEDQKEFSHFCDVFTRLTNPETKKNQNLQFAINNINWGKDLFHLHFISLSKMSEPINLRMKQGVTSRITRYPDLHDRIENIQFFGEEELNIELRRAIDAEQGITKPVKIEFPADSDPPWIIYTNKEDRRSYIGTVKISHIRQLFQEHKHALFAMNIRESLGNNKTNKKITDTATNRPENFFFYNNGISAIATDIKEEKDALMCTHFSVINGAQTVKQLHHAHSLQDKEGGGETVGSGRVLMRITEVSFSKKEKEKAFLSNITQFNNTQNAIKISDFRSNDPVQRSIQNEFKNVYFKGKYYNYKAKRTDKKPSGTNTINFEEFAKVLHAFKFGPADMFGGSAYLFNEEEGGGYAKIFGDGKEVWDQVLKEDFKEMAGVWFLCQSARELLKDVKENMIKEEAILIEESPSVKPAVAAALYNRLTLFYTMAELMRKIYGHLNMDLIADIRKWSDPNACLKKDEFLERKMAVYTEHAATIQTSTFKKAQESKGFNQRNWLRQGSTMSSIKQQISEMFPLIKNNLGRIWE